MNTARKVKISGVPYPTKYLTSVEYLLELLSVKLLELMVFSSWIPSRSVQKKMASPEK